MGIMESINNIAKVHAGSLVLRLTRYLGTRLDGRMALLSGLVAPEKTSIRDPEHDRWTSRLSSCSCSIDSEGVDLNELLPVWDPPKGVHVPSTDDCLAGPTSSVAKAPSSAPLGMIQVNTIA